MAYCTSTDVKLHAPQIPSTVTLTGYITDADGIIDSELRSVFVTPLVTGGAAVSDQIIETISAKLAAGLCLEAYYSQHNEEPSKYAKDLIAWAMTKLAQIAARPEMISCDLATSSDLDEDKSSVVISDDDPPYFTMGDPGGWK